MSGQRAVASAGASTPSRGPRRAPASKAPAPPPRAEPSPLDHSWVELDAGMPLPGPLELPASVVLAPADGAGDGVHRVRGHGDEALRRRLVAEFLAMGFEVAQARHDREGGLLAGPWVLQMRPPLDLAPAAATLTVRGQVRIRASASGAFPVRSDGDLVMEPRAHWRARLETARSARIGEGCRLDGPLACGGELDLGAGSVVTGGVRCEALRLGAGARIAGGLAMQAQAERPALVAVHRRLAQPLRSTQPEPADLTAPEAAPEAALPSQAAWPTPGPSYRRVEVRPGGPDLPAARPPRGLPEEEPVEAKAPSAALPASPSPVAADPPTASVPPVAATAPSDSAAPAVPAAPAAPALNERPSMEPGEEHWAVAHSSRPQRPRESVAAWSHYYQEFPERADLELDEQQTWRLLGPAEWLDVPSRETLRGEEFEFEGNTLGGHARFGILRNRRHVREVEPAQAGTAQADPLLRLVAHGTRPVLVRGRVHAGRLRLTMRAPDGDSLNEALALVGSLTATDGPGQAAQAEAQP